MRKSVIFAASLSVLALAGPAAAERFEANKISFHDITGAVEITTNSGDEIDVTVSQGNRHHSIAVVEKDGVVTITGERWRDDESRNCCDTRINREFHGKKGRKLSTGAPVDEALFAEYPKIIVAIPRKSDVAFVDARMLLKMEGLDGALNLDACYVYGETADVDEAVIGVISGSRLAVGNIEGGVEIDVSGDADVLIGNAALADVDIAGPGDVVLGAIDGILDISIAGSGVVRAARMDGPMTVRIAGSGGVSVQQGLADKLRVTIDGSGGVFFNGVAHQPELRLYGSSEVRLQSVTGRMKHVGGGEVYVDGKLWTN